MKVAVIILVLICSYSCSLAQSYIPGKIFKDSDTLKGFIREQIDKKNSKECLFKSSLSENQIVFSAEQIKGYSLENGKIYKSASVKTGTTSSIVFLQILTQGELNSYFLRQEGMPDRFFLEKNNKILEISGGKEIEVQGITKYSEGNYKGLLSSFLVDCEKRNFNLSKLRYARKDISNTVWQYNQCKDRDLYHYVPQKSKVVWGVKAGYYPVVANATPDIPAYYTPSVNQTGMGLQLGLFISQQILDVDKKLFFQAEAQYIYFHFPDFFNSDIKVSTLTLPASFKYYILSNKFSPYVEGGVFLNFNLSSSSSNKSFDTNTINPKGSGFLSGAGVRWRLAKGEFSLGYRYQKFHLDGGKSVDINGAKYIYHVEVNAHMVTLSYGF